MSNTTEELILPTVNLHESLLIVCQCQPFVAPVTGADGIRMSAAGGRGVQAELPLDTASLAELEGGNVAGQVRRVGSRGGEEVFAAM